MTIHCYLAPSLIEGLGVFTVEPLSRGTVVWRFDPSFDQVFPQEILMTQPSHIREFLERYTYAHHEDPGLLVLDADEGRFMNHSDAPNVVFIEPHVGAVIRDIAANEELTCDYRDFNNEPVVFQPPRHRVHINAGDVYQTGVSGTAGGAEPPGRVGFDGAET